MRLLKIKSLLSSNLFYLSLIMVLVVVTPLSQSAVAQSQSWTVEEYCINSKPPPDDWSFRGTILLSSPRYSNYGQIKAYSADLYSPTVIVDAGGDWILDDFDPRLSLSPDGKWYAVLIGNETDLEPDSPNHKTLIEVEAIQVYSTIDPPQSYRLKWERDYYFYWRHLDNHFPIRWFDNNRLFYRGDEGAVLINPFTGDVDDWGNIWIFPVFVLSGPSPDWSRIVHHTPYLKPWNAEWTLDDVETGETLREFPPMSPLLVWHPDSSRFVMEQDTDELDMLVLFDRDGHEMETIYSTSEMNDDFRFRTNVWSPDGRYLAFIEQKYDVNNVSDVISSELYIADMSTQSVWRTCITTSSFKGLVWSPDSKLLGINLEIAGTMSGENQLHILDVVERELHLLVNNFDSVIGWRE